MLIKSKHIISRIFKMINRLLSLNIVHFILVSILILINSLKLNAQTETSGQQVEILNANSLTGIETSYSKYRKLIGNVILSHSGVIMYCDSAYDYTDQDYFEAYGNIRIQQGDTISLAGKFLHYDIKERIAHINDNVLLTDGKMVLTTSKIIYDLKKKIAWYDSKAKIVDSNNVLTSEQGTYYANTKDMVFKRKVNLVNPDNTLSCDSMRYNIGNRTAHFMSPTHISGKKIKVYCEGGWYSTATRISEFSTNACINSESQTIYSDNLHYEIRRGYGRATGHVRIVDTNEKVTVTGRMAEHFKPQKMSLITDSALMIKYMSNDTMYIHADTLKIENQERGDTLLFKAYYHVISLSRELQFKTDSLIYSGSDSTIYFYNNPVIWSGENQVTARFMKVFLVNKRIDRVLLDDNALIISQKDSLRFDQVKGRNMLGYFENNELRKVTVTGNAEAIYYLLDDDFKYIGMNKIASSYIDIYFEKKKISGINFQTSPTGNVLAPLEMNTPDARLKGFKWRQKEKPEIIPDLFCK